MSLLQKKVSFNNALGDRDNIDPVGLQDELIVKLKKTWKTCCACLETSQNSVNQCVL